MSRPKDRAQSKKKTVDFDNRLRDQEHERWMKHMDLGYPLIARFLTLAFWAFLVWCATSWVKELAGKETNANLFLGILADAKVNLVLSWAGTITFGVLFFRERKLRKDSIERLQHRNKERELAIDSKRTSSELTARGDTRPEDK